MRNISILALIIELAFHIIFSKHTNPHDTLLIPNNKCDLYTPNKWKKNQTQNVAWRYIGYGGNRTSLVD